MCRGSLRFLITVASYHFSLNLSRLYYYNEEIPLQNEIIKSVLGDDKAPDMWSIESSADLLLINSFEILNNIRPSVPTTIYLGGIHSRGVPAPLSSSLAQFLDEAERVVYVNLNTAIQQDPTRYQKLLTALEKANVDVVWRLSDDYVNTTARIYQADNFDHESILGKFAPHCVILSPTLTFNFM